jgi:hypothetical protein
MGQRNRLMRRPPPKILERIATLLIPPASREEVLGDLHERCSSAWGYCKDALIVIPCVIASRIRRIVDPPVLLLQVTVVYLSFLIAAWIAGGLGHTLDEWELWRLTIPTGAILIGMVLTEVYAKPGISSRWQPVRGPLLGAALAFVSRVAVPLQILLYGAALSVILASITNLLCPPVTLRPQGANVTALWFKRGTMAGNAIRWFFAIFVGIALSVSSAWGLRAVQVTAAIAAVLVAYHVQRRT